MMKPVVLFVFQILLLRHTFSSVDANSSRNCELYLAPSLAGLGRGVIAGRNFFKNEDIQEGPSIPIQSKFFQDNWIFWNYVWKSTDPKREIAVLGSGSMFNHRNVSQISNYWRSSNNLTTGLEAYTVHDDFVQYASTNINIGEEMFAFYGERWLEQRQIVYNNSALEEVSKYNVEELEDIGFCLTDVFVDKSKLPKAGRGLFTKLAFKKGDIVTLSPVGVHSRHELEEASIDDVGINYAIASKSSDVILFQFGLSNMINHGSRNASNLYYEWYVWPGQNETFQTNMDLSAQDLYRQPYAPFDLAFRASRDIEEGEELLIDYGEEWVAEYRRYLDKLARWLEDPGPQNPRGKPQFRHPIEAPVGLFPEHWQSGCVGDSCQQLESELNETEVALALEYASNGYPSQLKDEVFAALSTSSEFKCDFYLAQSKLPFLGRGVIAARDFYAMEVLEVDPVIPILQSKIISDWALWNYVWKSSHPFYNMLCVGPGSLVNHRHDYQVHHYLDGPDTDMKLLRKEGYSTHASFVHYVDKAVVAGEEMFGYYGDTWLSQRKIPYNDTAMMNVEKYSLEELKAVGQCMSNTYTNQSLLPRAGRGLFAKTSFKSGEVVTVAPVAVLPKHGALGASDEGALINYCFASEDSDVALLPLTLAMLVNHGGNNANVRIEWHDWGGVSEKLNDTLHLPIENVTAMAYVQLDISYVALRDISPGEELTLNYGRAWEVAYLEYLRQLSSWMTEVKLPEKDFFKKQRKRSKKPSFRHPIAASEGMFPDHWKTDCIGMDCKEIKPLLNETEEVNLAVQYVWEGYPKKLVSYSQRSSGAGSLKNSSAFVCDLYWAPSKISGLPLGIVAGREFNDSETFEVGPAFPVKRGLLKGTMMAAYLYGSHEDDYEVAVLGPGNLFNHHNNYTAEFQWEQWPIPPIQPPTEGFSTYTGVTHYAMRNVSAGEEIFAYYSASYESSSHLLYPTSDLVPRYDLQSLDDTAHCLTSVYVNQSLLPKAGKGLFASKSFKANELVTISPVLLAPKHLIEAASRDGLFLNYVFVRNDSDVAAYPSGWAGIINHNSKENTNLRISWHTWDNQNHTRDGILSLPAEEVLSLAQSPINFAYYATRDIDADEELTIFYGEEWEEAWRRYITRLQEWSSSRQANGGDEESENTRPPFRHGITAPEGLFPSHWVSECLLTACEKAETTEPDAEIEAVRRAMEYLASGYPSPLIGNLTRIAEDRLRSERNNQIALDRIHFGNTTCDVYLAPSKEPVLGRGIIAGKSFRERDPMFTCPEIFLHTNWTKNWQTRNYVWGTSSDYHQLFAFGVWGLFNSRRTNNQAGFERIEDIETDFEAISRDGRVYFEPFNYFASVPIAAGDEIFTFYGDSWFASKGIVYNDSMMMSIPRYSLSELEREGVCLSDVVVRNSSIPMAGYGVFAKKQFKKGDVVSVSPVLLLPRESVEASSGYSPVLNFVLTTADSKVVLLPVTEAAIVNHGGKNSNLALEWYSWGNDTRLAEKLESDLSTLLSSPFSPLDIAYVAVRDIEVGEELTLFYGEEWEAAWRSHLTQLSRWVEYRAKYSTVSTDDKPQFRHPIMPRKELFPSHWTVATVAGSSEEEVVSEGAVDYNDIQNSVLDALEVSRSGFSVVKTVEIEVEVDVTGDLGGSVSTVAAAVPIGEFVCDLYVAPSKLPYLGRGVIAGHSFVQEEVFEISTSISIPKHPFISESQLMNYVYSSDNKGYYMALLGAGMIYNHMENYTAEFLWTAWPVPPLKYESKPYATYTPVGHYAMYNISEGQELFAFYSSNWLMDRNISFDEETMKSIPSYDLDELKRVGHCLTNVAVQPSSYPLAGNGIFSKLAFKRGDIISISPVLCLEKSKIEMISGDTVLLNYVISRAGSDMALLPISVGALANHGGKSANMQVEWYSWSSVEDLDKKLSLGVDELRMSPYAPLDIAYRATRDIEVGEELTVFYGEEWEAAWDAYLDRVRSWAEYRSEWPGVFVEDQPQFRHSIIAPDGLFPQHWMSDGYQGSIHADVLLDGESRYSLEEARKFSIDQFSS